MEFCFPASVLKSRENWLLLWNYMITVTSKKNTQNPDGRRFNQTRYLKLNIYLLGVDIVFTVLYASL